MGSKWILMLAVLVLLSLQCGLSLGEQLENGFIAGGRSRRQTSTGGTVFAVGAWVYAVACVAGCCICIFGPAIITGIVICCVVSSTRNRQPTQLQTTTTTATNPPYGAPPPNAYPGVAPPTQPYSGQSDLSNRAYPSELSPPTYQDTKP